MNTSFSMNSYLEHQSHKSHNLFEGTSKLEDLAPSIEIQQELQQVEQWLAQSRDNIEQAIAQAKFSQFHDDEFPVGVMPFNRRCA